MQAVSNPIILLCLRELITVSQASSTHSSLPASISLLPELSLPPLQSVVLSGETVRKRRQTSGTQGELRRRTPGKIYLVPLPPRIEDYLSSSFLLVVLSAYHQMRSQKAPVLSNTDEDNFDRAFEHFRPSMSLANPLQAPCS
jgi:hypothetical protein